MEEAFFAAENKTGLIVLSAVFFMFIMGITVVAFFYFSKKKIIQKELEKKEIELQHSKKLLQATLEVQEKERKRIAQDLHDDISSKLNVVSLNCHMLTMDNLEEAKKYELITSVIDISGKALENSRRIAHNLFPPVFDKFGLHAGIEEMCEEFNSTGNVVVNYMNNVNFAENEREKQMHVFRILQELINNSVRHGKASVIDIEFSAAGNKTLCSYSDNGKGFDVAAVENKKGLGMKNIQSRIDFINGTINIQSEMNKGTKINFTF